MNEEEMFRDEKTPFQKFEELAKQVLQVPPAALKKPKPKPTKKTKIETKETAQVIFIFHPIVVSSILMPINP